MDATKPYKFIGFGAMDVTKAYKFIGFGAMERPQKQQVNPPMWFKSGKSHTGGSGDRFEPCRWFSRTGGYSCLQIKHPQQQIHVAPITTYSMLRNGASGPKIGRRSGFWPDWCRENTEIGPGSVASR